MWIVFVHLNPLDMNENMSSSSPSSSSSTTPSEQRRGKRLYRSKEHQIIAGVCAGLAAYFGVEVIWVRLLFVVFAFANGLSIVVYLVMWALVPLAETPEQRAEMHGTTLESDVVKDYMKQTTGKMEAESHEAYERLKTDRSEIVRILRFPVLIVEKIMRAIHRALE